MLDEEPCGFFLWSDKDGGVLFILSRYTESVIMLYHCGRETSYLSIKSD